MPFARAQIVPHTAQEKNNLFESRNLARPKRFKGRHSCCKSCYTSLCLALGVGVGVGVGVRNIRMTTEWKK